ncbi:hypothetical protein Bca4012_010085 [Brassica carinata]
MLWSLKPKEALVDVVNQLGFVFSLRKQMKLKSQEQELAIPEPALIKQTKPWILKLFFAIKDEAINFLDFKPFATAEAALLLSCVLDSFHVSVRKSCKSIRERENSAKHGSVAHYHTDYLPNLPGQ